MTDAQKQAFGANRSAVVARVTYTPPPRRRLNVEQSPPKPVAISPNAVLRDPVAVRTIRALFDKGFTADELAQAVRAVAKEMGR